MLLTRFHMPFPEDKEYKFMHFDIHHDGVNIFRGDTWVGFSPNEMACPFSHAKRILTSLNLKFDELAMERERQRYVKWQNK